MSRRWRRRTWRPRNSGELWAAGDEDMPLATLLAMLKRTPTPRKKRTPRPTRAAPPPVITIEDTPESAQILNAVQSRVGTFMESGSFISSDEEEVEMVGTNSNKQSSNTIFLSDDSDDDFRNVQQTSSVSILDISDPGTSAGTSCNSEESKVNTRTDDLVELIDSVLPCANNNNKDNQDHLNDMESLEDFRKKTEEMLKDASTLIEEIKTGRKPQREAAKKEESPPRVTVGLCPVCLETLAGRPASVTVCGHIFCKDCIAQVAKTLKKCPTCRKNITLKKIHPIYF